VTLQLVTAEDRAVTNLTIALGAAVLAAYVSDWHPQLFVLGGSLMLGVADEHGTPPTSIPQVGIR
jgi:hypothetical protein